MVGAQAGILHILNFLGWAASLGAMAAPRIVAQTSNEVHDTAAQLLRSSGQRYTTSRKALVEILSDAPRPLTIPEMMETDDNIAQSSAYRNLGVMERAGVINRVVTTDEFVRYELAEALLEHHHHLICSKCGEVSDFVMSDEHEARLDEIAREVARLTSFKLMGHNFDLLGYCFDCTSCPKNETASQGAV